MSCHVIPLLYLSFSHFVAPSNTNTDTDFQPPDISVKFFFLQIPLHSNTPVRASLTDKKWKRGLGQEYDSVLA